MSTKNVFILIIFNSILFTFSCQSDQASKNSSAADDYIPNIYSRYLVLEKEFKIEVTFTNKKNNKLKNQAVAGDLFFRGQRLKQIETPYGGVQYMIQIPQSAYTELKIIEWKQGSKILGKFESKLSPIESFDIKDKKIVINEGFRLTWVGPPLAKTEFLAININPERGDQLKMNRLGPTDQSYCSVVPQQLTKLKPGTAQVSIIKNKRSHVKNEDGALQYLFFDEFYMYDQQYSLE